MWNIRGEILVKLDVNFHANFHVKIVSNYHSNFTQIFTSYSDVPKCQNTIRISRKFRRIYFLVMPVVCHVNFYIYWNCMPFSMPMKLG